MTHDSERPSLGRRQFVCGLAGAGATAAIGRAVARSSTSSTAGPPTRWHRTYDGGPRVAGVTLQAVEPTADGGYLLGGEGVPTATIETGPEQFLLVRTDADGRRQWVTLVDDGSEETADHSFGDVVQTTDGGSVVVGYARNPAPGADDRVGGKVARAFKLSAEGDRQWAVERNAFEDNEAEDVGDTGNSDDALFLSVAATADGGVLVGGTFEGRAWAVRIDASGSVRWSRVYDGFSVSAIWPDRRGGARLLVDRDSSFRVLAVDGSGAVQSRTSLAVDTSQTPYNQVFTPTTDGGYAYTGRDADRENMVLGRLSPAGERRWRTEFDGPSGGSDWARHLLQTDDGGFLLGGYMTSADGERYVSAVVRTDDQGREQWRRLFTEREASGVRAFAQAPDGRYACLLGTETLVELDAEPRRGVPGHTLDRDPLHEDVDGDGALGVSDLTSYFQRRNSPTVRDNPGAFDFDGDGDAGDIGDTVALFLKLLGR